MSNLFPYKNMKGIQQYNATGSQLQRIKLIIFTIVQIGRVFIIKKLPEVIEPLIRRLPSIYEASQQNNLILGMEWKVQEWNCAMVSVKAKLTFQPLSDSLPKTNSVHQGINPLSKTLSPPSCQVPLSNLQTVQALLFLQSHPLCWLFVNSP